MKMLNIKLDENIFTFYFSSIKGKYVPSDSISQGYLHSILVLLKPLSAFERTSHISNLHSILVLLKEF